jgi:methionyl aminopeptidase
MKFAKADNHLGDICAAIGDYLQLRGYSVPQDYTGHGVGRQLHEAPAIPNYGIKGSGVLLKSGMVLAIEPMVLSGSDKTTVGIDNWAVSSSDKSLTAHYENTVLVKDDGYEILTA